MLLELLKDHAHNDGQFTVDGAAENGRREPTLHADTHAYK